MDASRSTQEDSSDEDNNGPGNPPPPPPLLPRHPERNGGGAIDRGADDDGQDVTTVKPQRKKVFIHRCPFSHVCSHNHYKDGKNSIPLNVPIETPETMCVSDSLKIQDLCLRADSDNDGAEYSRLLKNAQNVEQFCHPVYSTFPEQKIIYLQRGLSRAVTKEIRRGLSSCSSSSSLPSTPRSDSLEESCGRNTSVMTKSCPPSMEAQHTSSPYAKEEDLSRVFDYPMASSPTSSHLPFSSGHVPCPEEGITPNYDSQEPHYDQRVPYYDRQVSPETPHSSQIGRITDTANHLASLGNGHNSGNLTYQFPSPVSPTSSSPPSEATPVTSSDGRSIQRSSCNRRTEVITPLFRQYCRHFFIESLCPGVPESEVRQVASAVECLEDRVYLFNAKSKIDYCYQLAMKLCCIQEELQQISKVSQQGISLLGEKGGGPS